MGNNGLGPVIGGKRAALFDMDGVLLDSLWVWHGVGLDFFAENDVPVDRQAVRDIRGMGFMQSACYLVKRFGLHTTPEKIVAGWVEKALPAYANEVALMPGAGALVGRLLGKGLCLAVVTASDAALAGAALKRTGIAGAFEAIVTEDEAGLHKDGPELFLHAARLLDVPPESCVVFEDSLYAMKSAKAAGMAVCALCPPERKAEAQACKAVADLLVESLETLLAAGG